LHLVLLLVARSVKLVSAPTLRLALWQSLAPLRRLKNLSTKVAQLRPRVLDFFLLLLVGELPKASV